MRQTHEQWRVRERDVPDSCRGQSGSTAQAVAVRLQLATSGLIQTKGITASSLWIRGECSYMPRGYQAGTGPTDPQTWPRASVAWS